MTHSSFMPTTNSRRGTKTRSLVVCCALMIGCFSLLTPNVTWAQAKRIFEEEPYDRITLDAANENAVLKVRLIPFPGRKVPVKPKSTDKLRVKLIDDARDFDIQWANIKEVKLFEELVLEEAKQVAAAGKLDEAYDYFAYLLLEYSQLEGLAEARQLYLYQCAGAAFREKKYHEALGLLEELHALNPDFRASDAAPTVMQTIGNTADAIIGGYVAKQDYRSARILLERLSRIYRAENEPFALKWIGQLSQLAIVERDSAQALLAQKKYVEAYDASARMQDIWPAVAGGPELLARMTTEYPLISVGVLQPAKAHDPRSLIDPAARRTGRLLHRQLMEFAGMGPEGGKYVSPFGAYSQSDDGSSFTIEVKPTANRVAPLSAFDVAERLLQLADANHPDYQAPWSRLVSTVQVKQATQTQVDLRLPHVLPEALLQVNALPADGSLTAEEIAELNSRLGPYRVLESKEKFTRFTRNENSPFLAPTQPAEIMERYYDDPQRQLLALERGEIDVIDQVFPQDLPALAQRSGIVVKAYSAPTTHMLLINREHPYLANRTFRRALLYAADRRTILNQGLLKGQKLPGWRVISSPFPAPTGSGDNIAYGYDEAIAPRDYDPRLAIILKVLAEKELKVMAEKKKTEAPKWRPLLLGHPADEASELACKALVKQWQIAGIECKLQKFPLGIFSDPKGTCDLTYVQAATWEPIVDAVRLFGGEGIAPSDNAFIKLAIKQIETSTNWQQVRQRMQQLDSLVSEDVTVIPLWQTYDHYAFRQGLTALEGSRVTLYQDVQQWRPVPRLVSN
jgi:hypothetical protein